MSQQSKDRPLSRDEVLDELEFLLTVEHALIVEYLSVCCALGHDLATADGGPATQASRDAATAANALAAAQMLRAGGLVRALSGVRPTGPFGRARGIVDATGREIPLGPPTREQLEHLLEREESIAAAVDARYARLGPAVAVGGPEDAFSDALRAAVEEGTTHANAASVLRDHLGDRPIADLLRATRRFGGTDAEKVLLRTSDRTYGLLLGALEHFFGDLNGDHGGTFRLMALGAMDIMNDLNRALVHAGLLPPFRMPPA
jgi:hypothetical protein